MTGILSTCTMISLESGATTSSDMQPRRKASAWPDRPRFRPINELFLVNSAWPAVHNIVAAGQLVRRNFHSLIQWIAGHGLVPAAPIVQNVKVQRYLTDRCKCASRREKRLTFCWTHFCTQYPARAGKLRPTTWSIRLCFVEKQTTRKIGSKEEWQHEQTLVGRKIWRSELAKIQAGLRKGVC